MATAGPKEWRRRGLAQSPWTWTSETIHSSRGKGARVHPRPLWRKDWATRRKIQACRSTNVVEVSVVVVRCARRRPPFLVLNSRMMNLPSNLLQERDCHRTSSHGVSIPVSSSPMKVMGVEPEERKAVLWILASSIWWCQNKRGPDPKKSSSHLLATSSFNC